MSDHPLPQASADERELIRRILAGERGAFDELVRAFHGRLLRVARGYVRSEALAEEVVQETWKAVFQQLPSFEGRASLRGWIFTILTNQAKTRAMRERRSVPFSALVEMGEDEPMVEPERFTAGGHWASPVHGWSADTPETIAMRREALAALEHAVEELPPNLRTVVTMRDLVGLSSEEVCNALGISEINQRVLLHRARGRLRKALAAHLETK